MTFNPSHSYGLEIERGDMKLQHLVIFGLLYSLAYIFFALNVVGMEGRGPLIFLAPLSPLGLPWIVLLVALFVLSNIVSGQRVVLFIIFMLVHYVMSLYSAFSFLQDNGSSEVDAFTRIMNLRPYAVYFTLAWYLLGQVIIWMRFVICIRNNHFSART